MIVANVSIKEKQPKASLQYFSQRANTIVKQGWISTFNYSVLLSKISFPSLKFFKIFNNKYLVLKRL